MPELPGACDDPETVNGHGRVRMRWVIGNLCLSFVPYFTSASASTSQASLDRTLVDGGARPLRPPTEVETAGWTCGEFGDGAARMPAPRYFSLTKDAAIPIVRRFRGNYAETDRLWKGLREP